MGYCPLVVLCLPLADLHHFRLTRGSLLLPAPSSRSERHLHFASMRLCLALLFIISILNLHMYLIIRCSKFSSFLKRNYEKHKLLKSHNEVAIFLKWHAYFNGPSFQGKLLIHIYSNVIFRENAIAWKWERNLVGKMSSYYCGDRLYSWVLRTSDHS